jgi:hypothetical protein
MPKIDKHIIDDEFSIPLDISDLLNICKEFNELNAATKLQLENIIDNGIENSLKQGLITYDGLPKIINFFSKIKENAYFGDAASQAEDFLSVMRALSKARNKTLN